MNIFNLLSQNLAHASRTRPPADNVPYPGGYRGRLEHAGELCIACGACVYACSPGAITIDEHQPLTALWQYTEDRCTFCGFCVQYCPTQALGFAPAAPEPLTERAQHYLSHTIALEPCRECGQPVRLIPESLLAQLYGGAMPEDIIAMRGLCERCRQRATGRRFMQAVEKM
ncbi:MAG: 4Fe-4S dicluster domain-containing protein [Chloroflexi bacterium]|nr:4Fe-4S dicluster domain-containing protein [Chloroflexota bacterium]